MRGSGHSTDKIGIETDMSIGTYPDHERDPEGTAPYKADPDRTDRPTGTSYTQEADEDRQGWIVRRPEREGI